jgi:hypothetical protein
MPTTSPPLREHFRFSTVYTFIDEVFGQDMHAKRVPDRAIRLASLLAEYPVGAVPETFALLALMHSTAHGFRRRRKPPGAYCSWKSRTGTFGARIGFDKGRNGWRAPPTAKPFRGTTWRRASRRRIACRHPSRKRPGRKRPTSGKPSSAT